MASDDLPQRQAHVDRTLVWIASYPKSGNTWIRILLANFLGRNASSDEGQIPLIGLISADRPTFDNTTGLASSDLTPDEIDFLRPRVYRQLARAAQAKPLFFKVHDGFQTNAGGEPLFPADCSRGVLLVVRHPMDVVVSLAHHVGHQDWAALVQQLGDAQHVMAGEGRHQYHQRELGWSGHYLSWSRQSDIPVLVVRYEDMLADTAQAFSRVLSFLGIPGADDREKIAQAVAASRFERLREIETSAGFPEIPVAADRFFRSGRAGEGLSRLPQDLRQRILDQHGPVMAELGYDSYGVVAP
jgi:hypothetical protein